MGNLLLSVHCIFTNAAICTWRQGSHIGWPELFNKDTEVQSAGNQRTEPFSCKFCAENIRPVNQYGRLLTWLQNWITKPTLEHLTPLTTWTAAQAKLRFIRIQVYSKDIPDASFSLGTSFVLSILILPVRHSDLEQLCHNDVRLRDSCRNTVGRALPYPTWQKTF